jgi:hypothetical protein
VAGDTSSARRESPTLVIAVMPSSFSSSKRVDAGEAATDDLAFLEES